MKYDSQLSIRLIDEKGVLEAEFPIEFEQLRIRWVGLAYYDKETMDPLSFEDLEYERRGKFGIATFEIAKKPNAIVALRVLWDGGCGAVGMYFFDESGKRQASPYRPNQ